MKTSKLLLAGILTTATIGSLLAVNSAHAHGSRDQSNLIDKIATKFNLDRQEVASIFKLEMESRHEKMAKKHEATLRSLVDNETITAEQKAAIDEKQEEMTAVKNAPKDQGLSQEEIHNKIEELRDNFRTWAEEQGIDIEQIRQEKQGQHRGEHRFSED